MKPYFAFQWHITDECDQRCQHCYIFSEDACARPQTYFTTKGVFLSTLSSQGFFGTTRLASGFR